MRVQVLIGEILALASIVILLNSASAQAPRPASAASYSTSRFETEIRPLLTSRCAPCHAGGPGTSGGLGVTSREALLKGGSSGSAIDLQSPEKSLLLRAVSYHETRKMPPDAPLTAQQVAALRAWIVAGAPWPATAKSQVAFHGPPPVNAETKRFWSFQPVKRPAVPHIAGAANPIDAFILARLQRTHLHAAHPAGKTELLRRATYDLIGLPPTPEETRAFLADKSPNAYEKVVDRLLASPHYGEKWARHWLDLVRYAETNSFERDDRKPFVWRYRDYVIRSLNADKPYDRFIREQLAGDEIDPQSTDSIIATGFYRLGAWDDEPSDPEQARFDELDDITATTGQVFLGLTVNCARCHDHKLDPIPQRDYYRLVACFRGVKPYGDNEENSVTKNSLRVIAPAAAVRIHDAEAEVYNRQMAALDTSIAAIEKRVQSDFTPVEKEDFKSDQNREPIVGKRVPAKLTADEFSSYVSARKQRRLLADNPPKDLAQALAVSEGGPTPPKTCILMRGNPHVPGDEVQPGFLSVLSPPDPTIHVPEANPNSSGRRTALANWIASPANPLTARVIVNRVWQHHFGRGIVRSPNNFGFQGSAPTHPELLDWLAADFVSHGWQIKRLHKLIMMSDAYRMSCDANPQALAKDPDNDLFWRFDMRRLDAEEIRDSILTVNGTLNNEMFGPSVFPVIPKEVLAGQSLPGRGWDVSIPAERTRRSIYVHVKRSLPLPMIASFDAADTDFTCPVRFATTQPTQALGLLNSDFINTQAKLYAEYLTAQAGPDERAQVRLGLWRVLQREPSQSEIDRGLQLVHRLRDKHHLSAPDALRFYCVVLLNLNEFVYLD
jgi:hypothetical protein